MKKYFCIISFILFVCLSTAFASEIQTNPDIKPLIQKSWGKLISASRAGNEGGYNKGTPWVEYTLFFENEAEITCVVLSKQDGNAMTLIKKETILKEQ